MARSKRFKRLITAVAAIAMVGALSLSASAVNFTDVHLPQFRNAARLTQTTLSSSSSFGIVNFSMLSSHSGVYVGISDTKTGATFKEIQTYETNKNHRLDYPTEVAKGRQLHCYAGNQNFLVDQYASGYVLF